MRAESRRRAWAVPAACLAVVLVSLAGAVGLRDAGAAPPDEIVSPSAVGEVRFPHSLHADELGFECSDCHHETDAARLEMPHPEYLEDFWIDCGSCHHEGTEPGAARSCGECHHASPVSTADETLSAKVVIHRSCWGCHDSGTGAEASASCGFCHANGPVSGEESP